MTIRLHIAGMTCVNCANSIERAALKVGGVVGARADFAAGKAHFDIEDSGAKLQNIQKKIIKSIESLGFSVVLAPEDLANINKSRTNLLFRRFLVAIVMAVIIMILEMNAAQNSLTNIIMATLAAAVLFGCGGIFFIHAFKALKNGSFDMNVLVSLGGGAAFIYSLAIAIEPSIAPQMLRHLYFSGPAMIVAFVLLGRFLEARASLKANEFLHTLLNLAPKTAQKILKDGSTQTILAADLKAGDMVCVSSGAAVPIDGEILSGGAEIDESALTGESLPKYRSTGDLVCAGAINTDGHIIIRASTDAANTQLAAILELLSSASAAKMPIARLADRVASVFVPAVLLIALITFGVWALAGQAAMGILMAVSVLLISCPCALGLATPIAVVAGVSAAAKSGVIIKNPAALERISGAKYAVFDKTGTLTNAELSVAFNNLDGPSLDTAVILSAKSTHPISKAICKMPTSDAAKRLKIAEFKSVAGMGLVGEYGDILVGGERLLAAYGVDFSRDIDAINRAKNGANIVVLVAINSEYKGFLALTDTIKDEAKECVRYVKSMGLSPMILSGDGEAAVKKIAAEAGINEAFWGLMPAQKFEKIKELQSSGAVIFVGDGINDAPALKASDIAIALGSDIAKNAGDLVLASGSLKSLKNALAVGYGTIKTIRQNLFWAFLYNGLCIPIAAGAFYAAGVWLTPMAAAAAMSISSVCVVLNSLRLFGVTKNI